MKIFEPLLLKFENHNWANNPELGLADTILESHPELIRLLAPDVMGKEKESKFGRGDTPSVEQIIRGALFKEIKNLTYRELEDAQEDSRICEAFVKIDPYRPYDFTTWQKYLSRITGEKLLEFMKEINKIAIAEGIEDIKNLRQDSTVIETNIHYPTNNSLVWDCIKESERLLEKLKEEAEGIEYTKYYKQGKKGYFAINVEKNAERRVKLFIKQLNLFLESINQVREIIKKKPGLKTTIKGASVLYMLERHVLIMEKVYDMTERGEIKKEKVAVKDKIFSIYEQHTDIIVKGKREALFGHKVQFSGGRSNLILTCEIVKGNPNDGLLFQGTIDEVIKSYGITPESSVTDGGYASIANMEYAKGKGIANIVFNKIVGSLKNVVKNKWVETRLKKWRAGMEAVISNLKRGFEIRRCSWKGLEHYKQKILWSVIGYNIRTMALAVIKSSL